MGSDHRATPRADEWDVLPFLATDASGHGAFASSVDVAMPDAMLETLASMSDRRWVLCLANNTTDAGVREQVWSRRFNRYPLQPEAIRLTASSARGPTCRHHFAIAGSRSFPKRPRPSSGRIPRAPGM